MADTSRGGLKGMPYELFMLGLALLSIVNLVPYGLFPWESASWWLVVYIDVVLTAFLGDFIYRRATAHERRRQGWVKP